MIETVTDNIARHGYAARDEAVEVRRKFESLGFTVGNITYEPARSLYVFEVKFR